jgi:hypothetical protein
MSSAEPLSHDGIRAMKRECYSNWEILQHLIHDCGMEFPDASARVAAALRMDLDEVEQMEKDYDEIC